MRAMLTALYRSWRKRPTGSSGRGPGDEFLRRVRGVIHVGASEGQERGEYASYDLNVIWVEPIPSAYKKLCENIAPLTRQRAVQGLIGDTDDQVVTLNVSSNDGHSSSIFELGAHKEIWPEVSFVDRIEVRTVTLDTLQMREGWDLSLYGALVIDTQGADLMVLRGAMQTLKMIRYVKVEAANFPAYHGASLDDEIVEFLAKQGFAESSRCAFEEKPGVGTYFDILFERRVEAL